jgi:hypothetical protein
MKIYKEIKQIAENIEQIKVLVTELANKGVDIDGIEWWTAEFVLLSKDDIEYFKSHNGETEEYFVDQSTGYCGDDYFGYLYFKTDVPAQYVKVYYEC